MLSCELRITGSAFDYSNVLEQSERSYALLEG